MASTALAKINEPKDAPKWTDVTVSDLFFFFWKTIGALLTVSVILSVPVLAIAAYIDMHR